MPDDTPRHDTLRHPPASPTAATGCPLGTRWVTWKFWGLLKAAHLSAAERRRILATRRAVQKRRWTPAEQIRCEWTTGPGDSSVLPDGDGAVVRRLHHHTTFEAHGHTVHIDVVGGTHYGPGASYHLVMLYLDGLVRDQNMRGGSSIGCGTCGGGTPTVIVNPTCAIEVETDPGAREADPEVWMPRRA